MAALMQRLKRLFGRSGPEADAMLRSFVSELDVRTTLIAPRVAGDPARERLHADIRQAIDGFFTAPPPDGACPVQEAWNRAYRLERLLALIEPDDTLVGEVQRRLEEADAELVPAAGRLRTVFEAAAPHLVDTAKSPPAPKAGTEARMRAMLLDILEETHWSFQRKFHARPIQKSATRRVVAAGLVACTLFVLPFGLLYHEAWRTAGTPYVPPFEGWVWLPLWTALTAGFFGAMFSRLTFLQSNWNLLSLGALRDARDIWSILLRGAVGMTGAVVVYYFLLAGVVDGALFPKFDQIGLQQLYVPARATATEAGAADPLGPVPLRLILPNTHLALLVVWSFLAGFSERLVPSILQSTETTLRSRPREAK